MVMLPRSSTFYNSEQKLWSGPNRKDYYNDQLTLAEAIFMALTKQPQKIIQINDATKEQLTAKEFMDFAQTLGMNILKRGLKRGDNIGLYAQNSTHTATVMLASFLCGTPVNALYPGFDKDGVKIIYKVTTPKIIFCDIENYSIAREVCADLQLNALIFVMNGELDNVASIQNLLQPVETVNYENFRFPCANLKGDDTAVILCSSGTTGTPKGVLCSHRALLNQNVYFTLKSSSVLFSFSTMYWASGLWTLTTSLINCCLRIVTDKPFTPKYFLHLVDHYKITHIMASSGHMAELSITESAENIQKCLSSVDTLLVGGSKVPQIVQENMNQILSINTKRPGFAVAYGMSELSGMLSFNGGYPCERQEGSEGKLVANRKVRIINKHGELLGPNEHGEILIQTPYTWFGYYRNSEATHKALIDNWLHTGDIGYFDSDGFLHVCARDNDVFKSRNFQIYPQLIEDVVTQIPGILEACIIGIPDFLASNLTACVVVRTQDDKGIKLTAKEIEAHVEANMASMYHLTGGVYFIDVIPKTGSGKVQRHKVLDLVSEKIYK